MNLKNNKFKFKNKNLCTKNPCKWFVFVDEITGMYGFKNNKGKILIENLNDCTCFQEEFAVFQRGKNWGWISSSGKIIYEGFDCCWNFKNGYARFVKNKNWGWIDNTGKILRIILIGVIIFKKDLLFLKKMVNAVGLILKVEY